MGRLSPESALLHKTVLIVLFSKDSWNLRKLMGKSGQEVRGTSPFSLSPFPHHDLHHDGATPLSDKVLGDDCVNKLSSIFTFWRALLKFEEILKVNFFPPSQ